MKRGVGMRLKGKLLVLFTTVSVLIAVAVGGILYVRLRAERLTLIRESISRQLQGVDFILNNFFAEVEGDVSALADNEVVRHRDDRRFTSFLAADEKTFHYDYTEPEKRIIRLFNGHRVTHPSVNSVYMGRENGTSVRSHPRERPTRYDPRERPWYMLAKANPGKTMRTDAYPSLTTRDVNIGVVKALVDGKGKVFGVVGIDVTLANLTGYILGFQIRPAGRILVVDKAGVIIASQQEGLQGRKVEDYSPVLRSLLEKGEQEVAALEMEGAKNVLFHLRSAELDWRIAVLIPEKEIEKQIGGPVMWTVLSLSGGLALMSLLTLVGLHLFVIHPLRRFIRETDDIARTADLDRSIVIGSRDEIGDLARSYNQMISTLDRSQKSLKESERELRGYRDHLEELVRRRTGELEEANLLLRKEIEERELAERAVAERETQYRVLVESANSVILRWSPDGRVTFFNRFAQEFFGYREDEIIGRNIVGTIVPAQDSAGRELTSLAERIAANPETYARNQNENIRRDGERVWVAWANKAILGRDGQVAEILSVGVDITQLVLTERELRKTLDELAVAKERAEAADQLKSAFLATMSHELRTPLNSIIGFTAILLQGLVGPLNREQELQLNMVRGSASHLLSLISDVLDISKIEAGQLTVIREPVDMKESIGRVVQGIRPLAGKKGLELLTRLPAEIPPLVSDKRRVEQILLNLLSNAVKFTEKGTVGLTLTVGPEEMVIEVRDTGIGMRSEEIGGIFKPFRQIDTGLTRKYEGTGLGLSICKKLVELLGGRIWVESVPGKGSAFRFSLPRERSPS
jgi:PAS domain S-box-containing protein